MSKMISFYPQGDREPKDRSDRVDFFIDEKTGMVRYAGHRSPLTAAQRTDLHNKIEHSQGPLYQSDSHRRLITVDRNAVMSLLVKNELKP